MYNQTRVFYHNECRIVLVSSLILYDGLFFQIDLTKYNCLLCLISHLIVDNVRILGLVYQFFSIGTLRSIKWLLVQVVAIYSD